MTEPVTDQPIAEPESFIRLRQLRQGLLRLHKVLLDAERAAYEQIHGAVPAGKMLNLVIGDPQFAWLHAISELIVRIDEMFDAKEPATSTDAEALLAQVSELLQPSEPGTEFWHKYFAAMQNHPDAVLAHRDVSRILSAG
ncbi:MAG: hypothetical protein ABIP75_06155 [Pyrinomonadaceae bacterium]